MFSRMLKRILAPQFVPGRDTSLVSGAFVIPVIEPMERRLLYTVTASLNTTTHVLTVTGDGNNNVITVYQTSTQIDVDVNNTTPDLGPWAVGDVTSVKINGGGGAETLVAESSISGLTFGTVNVSKPVEFYGNLGNDILWGSNNADLLDGGADHDTLHGGNGSDTMYGGTGNDLLRGDHDTASDYMYGGAGSDTFFAGDGGFDYIDGEGDSDTVSSSDPTDNILNVP